MPFCRLVHIQTCGAAVRSQWRPLDFFVISVSHESAARFETQMGQCAVLVLCHLLHLDVHKSLANEFRKYCLGGVVVVIVDSEHPLGRIGVPVAPRDGLERS